MPRVSSFGSELRGTASISIEPRSSASWSGGLRGRGQAEEERGGAVKGERRNHKTPRGHFGRTWREGRCFTRPLHAATNGIDRFDCSLRFFRFRCAFTPPGWPSLGRALGRSVSRARLFRRSVSGPVSGPGVSGVEVVARSTHNTGLLVGCETSLTRGSEREKARMIRRRDGGL